MNGDQSSSLYYHVADSSTTAAAAATLELNYSLFSTSSDMVDIHREQGDRPESKEAEEAIQLTQDMELIIYGYVMPVVNSLGIVAAIVCIIVFTRRQMRSSLNVYLAGLSVFDLLVLLMGLLIYPPMTHCVASEMKKASRGAYNEEPSFICVFFWRTALATYPLSVTAQAASVWTCVAITIDRFLAVKYPLQMRSWCTPQKAACVLSAIAVFSIVYKFPTVFELTNDEQGRLVPTTLRRDEHYKKIYTTYSYLLVLFLIPWAIMIVLNIVVIRAVHTAYKLRRTMTHSRQVTAEDRFVFTHIYLNSCCFTNSVGERGKIGAQGNLRISHINASAIFSERRCTVMAMIIIVTFVIFNLVASINNLVETSFSEPDSSEEPLRFVWQRAAVFVGNLLICVNSSSNFCIYCLFGRRFRQMCALIFCPCLVEKNATGYHSLLGTNNGGFARGSTQGTDTGGSVAKDFLAMRKMNYAERRTMSTANPPSHGLNGSSLHPHLNSRKRSADVLLVTTQKKYSNRLCAIGDSVEERVI